MKSQIVKINEEMLTRLVTEATMRALNEEHPMMGLGAMASGAKYHFTNHKKWIKRADKICNALDQLLLYLDNNAEDEDCEKIENAISLIEDVIRSLERYSNNETE